MIYPGILRPGVYSGLLHRLAPVQSVLNAAARMIARLPPYSHISDCMINELHWLPVLARVIYKVVLLVAKSQQDLASKYLCELMSKPLSARSSRPLRSADRCDLLYTMVPYFSIPESGLCC